MHRHIIATCSVLLCAGLLLPSVSRAASNDGNVEWAGVNHLAIQDRRPICPLSGETFDTRVRAWVDDLTGAQVHYDDGTTSGSAAAVQVTTEGPYAIWEATIPASSATATVNYYFSVTDGADTDYYGTNGMVTSAPSLATQFAVDFATNSHAPMGATVHPTGGVVFRVWSPTTTSAHVRGVFNSWGLTDPMTRVGDDWIAVVPTAAVNHRYKFFFDSLTWNTDAVARSVDANDGYNALVQDSSLFPWAASGYQTPPLEEMVIYQLHVGTFPGLNDPLGGVFFPGGYRDIADRVAHLVDLGVNAIMLNPINEFPGAESAGYNPVLQTAPERAYGAPNDVRRLVEACHNNGIAVLLDIVWNHVSPTDNVLWDYDGTQIYFDTPNVDTPWGAQADFDAQAVRDMYLNSAHMWLEEFKIDGFRFDGSDYMNIDQHVASGWSLMQELNDMVDARWADRIVIAEQLPDDTAVTTPTASGGAGFDAQYFDKFTDDLRQEIFDAALGDPEMWKIRDIINGFGTYLSGARVLNYLELHDEAWPESGGQRIVKDIDTSAPHDNQWAKGRTKLAQGLTLLAPGIPAILQGTEWLEDIGFGAQSGDRIDWAKKTTYAGIFSFYQDVIALRTSEAVLRADSFTQVFHYNESGNIIGFRRGLGDETILVLANFSNGSSFNYRIGVPSTGDYEILVDSQDVQYEGSGALSSGLIAANPVAWDGMGQSITLDFAPMSLVVLRKHNPLVAVEPQSALTTNISLAPARPNPSYGVTMLSYTLPKSAHVSIVLHDVRGRRVRVLEDGVRTEGQHILGLNTRGLARGAYFVRLKSAGESVAQKILVLD